MVSELYTDNNWRQCKTPRNFPVTRFTEEMSPSFSSLVFSLPLILCDTLLSFSHHSYKNFMLFFQNKMSPFFFLSLALALCRSLSCWALLAWYVLSLSLLQDTGGYAISCQNNLELLYLLIELFYTGIPVVWMDGLSVSRSVGNTVMWLPKSPWWVDKCIFLGTGLRSRAHGAPLSMCISVFLYLEFVTGCFHFQPSLELVASIPECKNIP